MKLSSLIGGNTCKTMTNPFSLSILIILLLSWYCVDSYRTRIYWFHRNSCPACMSMKPEWIKFENLTNMSMIKTIRVETDDPRNQKLAENFQVSSVPHIVKVHGEIREVFKGDRTAGQLLSWAKS
jgi:thiol-disulfide isomerase/thioredoxin